MQIMTIAAEGSGAAALTKAAVELGIVVSNSCHSTTTHRECMHALIKAAVELGGVASHRRSHSRRSAATY